MAVEFKESKTFLMIPTGAAYDPDLLKLPKSILVLGEIVSMLNITGSFYMSNSALAKKLDCSTSTIGRYLALLEEKKLIRRKSIKDEKGNIQYRKIYAGEKLAKTFTQNWQADSLAPIPTGDQGVPTHEQGVYPHVTKGIPTCEQPLYPHVSNKENNIRDHIKDNNIRSNDQLLADRFEKIWAEYPKKQGKKDAFKHYKAWIKQSNKHTDNYLLEKLSQYKTYLKANNTQFQYIQKGSTWFNGSFDDDWSVKGNGLSNVPAHASFGAEAYANGTMDGVDDDDLPF